ncbi:MAG: uncharacterized protein JWN07_2064 [Hyphomicrobiales bacterium]|nr:uncharacterized protein [Hyphomicrobiales bacterium]
MTRGALVAIAGVLTVSAASAAESVKDFYTGKTLNIIVSTGSGTVFDTTARLLSRHMPNYLPGAPSIVVRNMPGGGHIRATQYMFAQAPRDGTYLATINSGIPLEQIVTGPSIRFDVGKFNWLGSAGLSNLLTMTWSTSGVTTFEQATQKELIAGATGASSNGYLYANVMNTLLGAKFKIVAGYGTSGEADLAMERGEVNARAGFSYTAVVAEHPDWLRDKRVNVLFQTGLKREDALPDVPLMHELAKTPEQREVLMLLSNTAGLGRPFFAPPDVPADRLAALREAFRATMNDPNFLAESQTAALDIRYMDWQPLTDLVNSILNAPEPVAEKVRAAWGRPSGAAP